MARLTAWTTAGPTGDETRVLGRRGVAVGSHAPEMGLHTGSEPTRELFDRQRELEALEGLFEDARSGRGWALVVSGEAGVGKTALLDYVVSASDLRVVRATGVESEMELAFAGLHQLCSPLLDRLGRLPAPQRDALEV